MKKIKNAAILSRCVLSGINHYRRHRVRSNGNGRFREEAGSKIENVAGQIRQIGEKFHSTQEAHRIARGLEKTADYVRFRSRRGVADDALHLVKRNPVAWGTAAGTLLAGAIFFGVVKRRES